MSIQHAVGFTSCRRERNEMWFRMAETGKEDGILAVALTAATTGLTAEIGYQSGTTTGCGSEPKVDYITIDAQ